MRLPVEVKRTKKCGRYGLLYPKSLAHCSHCANLSDQEVEALKDRYREERKGSAHLGRLFLYVAALILVCMLVWL